MSNLSYLVLASATSPSEMSKFSNYTMASHHEAALDLHHTNSMIDFVESNTVKPFNIPIVGLLVGASMMQVENVATVGKLVLYVGAQS